MLRPAALGLPADRFHSFRSYTGFDQLATAIDLASSSVRFPQLSAPPGAGKSLTYVTAALLSAGRSTVRTTPHRTLILVGTKGLMRQLLDDFGPMGLQSVVGHRNYSCAARMGDRRTTVGSSADSPGSADDLDVVCRRPKACEYRRDCESVARSTIAVTTYALWMSLARYGDPLVLGEFDLLVLDEAHTAPYWLSDFCAVDLDHKRVMKTLQVPMPAIDPEDIAGWSTWAYKHLDLATERLRTARPDERGKVRRMLIDLELLATAGDGLRTPWVGRAGEGETKIVGGGVGSSAPGPQSVRLQPVWGIDYAESFLFQHVPRVLLVSATLTPETGKQLGIPPEQSAFIEVPSPFPAANRPFIYVPTCKVDYRTMGEEGMRRRLVAAMDRYMGSRLEVGWSGLVHTRSYAYAKMIVERSKHADRMIVYRGSHELRRAFDEFRERALGGDPCILVGPSFEEGYDFAGDLARWQIVLKVSVLDRRDPLVAARIKFDKSFPDQVAAESILQIAGRPVRSDVDWAETVTFDDHWKHVRLAHFPGWFKAAWKWCDEIPPPMVVRRTVGR